MQRRDVKLGLCRAAGSRTMRPLFMDSLVPARAKTVIPSPERLSAWWERTVRHVLAGRLGRSAASARLAIIGMGVVALGLVLLMHRGLAYEGLAFNDVGVGLLVLILAAAQFVPAARRIELLSLASIAWQIALTPVVAAVPALISAVGVYYAVKRPNWAPAGRYGVLAALIAVFVASAWSAVSGRWDHWTVVAGVYYFGWGAMILRLVYFIAEGPSLRRGAEGDRLSQYIVFVFYYPFTLKLVVMSYAEFLRSASLPVSLSVGLRGVETLGVATLKCLAVIGLERYLLPSMRKAHADGQMSSALRTAHLWLETCSPYVAGYLAMSLNFDIGTAWARLFGWNLEPAFRNPLASRNMKELWVRWNVFFRQALVNLCFYPVVRAVGDPLKPVRHAAALTFSCLLTFLLSAAVHILFWGWTPVPSVMYFVLQSIPVAFVLVHEHFSLQRARALRRRPEPPDPHLTPLWVAATFLYQSLLHFHFRDPHESAAEAMRMFLAAPVRLFLPLVGGAGYWISCALAALAILRWLWRRRRWEWHRALPRAAVVLAAGLGIASLGERPAREACAAMRAWTESIPVGAEWSIVQGIARYRAGQTEAASAEFRRALQFSSQPIVAREQLARLYAEQGRFAAAAEESRRALESDPARWQIRLTLAAALAAQGLEVEAMAQLRMAYETNPRGAIAGRTLAKALRQRGDEDAAMSVLRRLRIDVPDDPEISLDLAQTLVARRNYAEAIGVLREEVQRRPEHEGLATKLIWLLAASPDGGQRDGAGAVRLAQRISRNGESNSFIALDALAVAFAEVGRFADAVQIARRAEQLARAAGEPQLAGEIVGRIRQYQRRQPVRLTR
jgi:Tfp pilus assembly protein PilF